MTARNNSEFARAIVWAGGFRRRDVVSKLG